MYAQHFGLSKEPFSIAPDPRFLFMSEQHREALAHLLYGVGGGGGFVLLTGEIGAGKTTVCRCFLEQIPKHCDVAYIFNPKLTVGELLRTVCDEFHVQRSPELLRGGTVKDYVDALNGYLLAAHAAGRSAVLIIDEAQSLAPDVLEQLRLLTNLETHERKLLQIILIGQPELREMLARPGLEQLAQRVIARYHLGALSAAETARYVKHRLAVAGASATMPFEPAALARIHQLTAGVPRRINLLAGRALLGTYAHGRGMVDRATVDRAADEVFGARPAPPTHPALRASSLALGALAVLGLGGAALAWWWQGTVRQVVDAASTPVVPALNGASAVAAKPANGAGPVAAGSSAGAPAAAAPAAATTTPAPDDSAALLAAAWTDEESAWRELARAWNAQLAAGEPCREAGAAGLACYRMRGGIAAVRQVQRPGLVALKAGEENAVFALLVGLNEREVLLRTRGRSWQLAPSALAQVWRGDYATLWRPPPGWREGLEAAEGPIAKVWLEMQLAGIDPDAKERPLRERIFAFQVAQGLKPDGVAGPLTMMQINRASGVDEPRLQGTR